MGHTDCPHEKALRAMQANWSGMVEQSKQKVEEARVEARRYRAAIQAALNSDLALTEHDPEWRACRDAVMNDLRRALDA